MRSPTPTRSRAMRVIAVAALALTIRAGSDTPAAALTTGAQPTGALAGGSAQDPSGSVAMSPATDSGATTSPPSGGGSGDIGFDRVRQVANRVGSNSAYDVVLVGDSLTEAVATELELELAGDGWRPFVDGKGSRSISYPADVEYSAVDRVTAIRGLGIDAPTWVVQLGTNDLYFIDECSCEDVHGAAVERVRLMLDAIGPGRRIVWVGVQNFHYPEISELFNTVLTELVASGEIDTFVDWAAVSEAGGPDYFVDQAHLSDAGYAVWIPAIVNAL